jgi:ribonuclease E
VKASAKKAPGKASAPMAKPETVISSGVIPKEFVASEQRVAHSKSDKLASMAHATSRHSAGATKPSMD